MIQELHYVLKWMVQRRGFWFTLSMVPLIVSAHFVRFFIPLDEMRQEHIPTLIDKVLKGAQHDRKRAYERMFDLYNSLTEGSETVREGFEALEDPRIYQRHAEDLWMVFSLLLPHAEREPARAEFKRRLDYQIKCLDPIDVPILDEMPDYLPGEKVWVHLDGSIVEGVILLTYGTWRREGGKLLFDADYAVEVGEEIIRYGAVFDSAEDARNATGPQVEAQGPPTE